MKPVPGSPCQNCDFSYRCADDDQTCPEYEIWFRPWLRRNLNQIRRETGKKRNPVAWRYFAPYEPTETKKAEPEKEEPPFDLDDALRELDRLHDAVPRLNPRTELSAFSAHLSWIVERRMHMGPTEYGRRCGISASRAASYVDGYHCPRGEVYEALKKGLREKWEEMQHERI